MKEVAYFAYGSLVNSATRLRPNARAEPALLKGWLRQWKHCIDTDSGKACVLSVRPRVGAEIEGVWVLDNCDTIAEVDRREIGYHREHIPYQPADTGLSVVGLETYIYVSTGDHNRWGDREYPIWLSYLDCVLDGYIKEWGPAGASRFITSTEGWDVPVLNDRARPKYPRAVVPENRVAIDRLLEESGITRYSV